MAGLVGKAEAKVNQIAHPNGYAGTHGVGGGGLGGGPHVGGGGGHLGGGGTHLGGGPLGGTGTHLGGGGGGGVMSGGYGGGPINKIKRTVRNGIYKLTGK